MAVVIRHLHDNFADSPVSSRPCSRPCSRQFDAYDLPKFENGRSQRGIADLPVEVLYQIVHDCAAEPSIYPRLKALRALRQTCRLLNLIVTPYIYEQAAFSGPHAFARFLREIKDHPERGRLVRNLDFSAFTSIGLGRSKFANGQYTLLTAASLAECLLLCPNVEELFMSEALQTDIDTVVLHNAFTRMQRLKAIDFCGASSIDFARDFASFGQLCAVSAMPEIITPSLARLSLHHCAGLSADLIEQLLSRLPHLTHLDLANTAVTWSGLSALPRSCRLVDLNLSHCARITGAALLHMMADHPAASTLERLNLFHPWNNTHPLAVESWYLDIFINLLPAALKSLDLGGMELSLDQVRSLPAGLIEFGCHDIDLADMSATPYDVSQVGACTEDTTMGDACLSELEYLALSVNVISSEISFASVLGRLFPRLAVIESPGFKKLPLQMPRTFTRVEGAGRRSWVLFTARSASRVEGDGHNWHPRKTNMSLAKGAPRGLYNYYSYRVR